MNKAYLSAVVVELVGITVVSGGIVFEYHSGDPSGFAVITVGSVIIAIGSLFYAKVYSKLKRG